MIYKKIIRYFCMVLFTANAVHAQSLRFDSVASVGNITYSISCNNKHADQNIASVDPKGFKGSVRSVQIPINGRVRGMAIADLNNNGFPDVVMFVYHGNNEQFGNVVGVSGKDNATLVPVYFPDIYNDPKLRQGYKGGDVYSIVIGLLQRSFPVYKEGDTTTATGGTRVIQYNVTEVQGVQSFKVLRTYDEVNH